MKILVIDDSGYARKRLAHILEGAGHRVVEADGGETGLALLADAKPDAITLDLLMPSMDGIEVLRRIRKVNPGIPVVVISADVQERTLQEVRAAGATAFVGKLAPKEDLLRTLDAAMTCKGCGGLSVSQMHAFTELMKLSMGRAAHALEGLLERRILIQAPQVEILEAGTLLTYLETNTPEIGTAAEQAFTGEINGQGYLVFPTRHAETLVQALIRQDQSLEGLSAADKTILTEVANVILNAVISDLGNRLQTRLRMGLPSVYFQLTCQRMAEIMLGQAPEESQAVVLISWLHIDEIAFVCYLVLITGAGDIHRLLENMMGDLS